MLGNKAKSQFYRVGGTRGGQGLFKWEDVKTDKDRENYLGHRVHGALPLNLFRPQNNYFCQH